MRDPDGSLELRDGQLLRHLHGEGASRAFLATGLCRSLVNDGLLVPFTVEAPDRLRVERLEFVSAPFEWCDAQLDAAARLTLEISERLHAEGHELKDASAWNVLFRGAQPIFCDQLSFQPIRTRQWWAFGQFLRHFVFPLQVSRTAGLQSARVFRMSRDGLSADDTRRILGLRRFFTRSWPLLISTRQGAAAPAPLTEDKRGQLHLNLYKYCGWALGSRAASAQSSSHWAGYTTERAHYSESSVQRKAEVVASWLTETRPRWLIDYGANTGEYTRMAAEQGIQVIAVEQDPTCVTQIFHAAQGQPNIHSVCANLADLCGGAGWAGNEHAGLAQRLAERGDMVLMLALIHHLAVSESIPFEKIAELAANTTTRHAIVELIGETDPLLGRLAAQRGRRPEEFSMARQRAAFEARFDIVAELALPETQRQLVLLKKRAVPG